MADAGWGGKEGKKTLQRPCLLPPPHNQMPHLEVEDGTGEGVTQQRGFTSREGLIGKVAGREGGPICSTAADGFSKMMLLFFCCFLGKSRSFAFSDFFCSNRFVLACSREAASASASAPASSSCFLAYSSSLNCSRGATRFTHTKEETPHRG